MSSLLQPFSSGRPSGTLGASEHERTGPELVGPVFLGATVERLGSPMRRKQFWDKSKLDALRKEVKALKEKEREGSNRSSIGAPTVEPSLVSLLQGATPEWLQARRGGLAVVVVVLSRQSPLGRATARFLSSKFPEGSNWAKGLETPTWMGSRRR